jgi:hypothetical protein
VVAHAAALNAPTFCAQALSPAAVTTNLNPLVGRRRGSKRVESTAD